MSNGAFAKWHSSGPGRLVRPVKKFRKLHGPGP